MPPWSRRRGNGERFGNRSPQVQSANASLLRARIRFDLSWLMLRCSGCGTWKIHQNHFKTLRFFRDLSARSNIVRTGTNA